MEMSWLLLGVMLLVLTANTVTVHMKINPKRALTQKNGSAEIMCDMKLSATKCFFHVWYVDYHGSYQANHLASFTPLDLKKKSVFRIIPRPKNGAPLFKASYHGEGLALGQCGVKLFALTPGTYFVGCRVRHETSGWAYDYMALVVQNSTGSQIGNFQLSNVADFEMVNVKENETSKLIDFPVNLSSSKECRLFLPEKGSLVAKGSDLVENTDMHHKAKWHVTESTVSVTLLDVTSGGPLWCLCRDNPRSDFTEFDVKVVTVLKAPKATEARKLEKTNFTEGETLTATCVARYARPVAKIVWWLGGDVIRNNTDDDNVDDATMDIDPHDPGEPKGYWPWRWPWNTKSIKQVLNHVLTLNDSKKELTCQVLHPALDGGQQNFTYSNTTVNASKDSNVLLIAGLVLGAILVANVAGVVIFCTRSRPVSAPIDISQTNRECDDGHYEKINETMFSHAIPAPPLPVRRTEARVGRLSVPRESAPPRPEEPEYIIPDNPDGSVNPDGYLRPLARSNR